MLYRLLNEQFERILTRRIDPINWIIVSVGAIGG